jgi:hypothetical protein
MRSSTQPGTRWPGFFHLDAQVLSTMCELQNMKTSAVNILGKEAERMNEVWGLDEEGETKVMWRATGHRESAVTLNIFCAANEL